MMGNGLQFDETGINRLLYDGCNLRGRILKIFQDSCEKGTIRNE
jgi:hypothetical protein